MQTKNYGLEEERETAIISIGLMKEPIQFGYIDIVQKQI